VGSQWWVSRAIATANPADHRAAVIEIGPESWMREAANPATRTQPSVLAVQRAAGGIGFSGAPGGGIGWAE
jgi:hypothetical protein